MTRLPWPASRYHLTTYRHPLSGQWVSDLSLWILRPGVKGIDGRRIHLNLDLMQLRGLLAEARRGVHERVRGKAAKVAPRRKARR